MMEVQMRTIKQAAQHLKEMDPSTCIGEGFIRRRILDGSLPHVKAGNRKLIDLSVLYEFLSRGMIQEASSVQDIADIRKYKMRNID